MTYDGYWWHVTSNKILPGKNRHCREDKVVSIRKR
jgi:hypothetical protein